MELYSTHKQYHEREKKCIDIAPLFTVRNPTILEQVLDPRESQRREYAEPEQRAPLQMSVASRNPFEILGGLSDFICILKKLF